jgi:hypothetical protein
MNVFHHTGDLGDVIAALPIIRELGGGKLVISDAQFPRGFGPRETLRGKRFEALQPIVKAAPYVESIEWHDNPQSFITHDIASFRGDPRKHIRESLLQWQANYFQIQFPEAPEPWLRIENPKKHNKIVVSRTLRYNTTFFPWRLIVDKHVSDLVFIGLPDEYNAFAAQSKLDIEYWPTKDLYEAAEIIAGSRLFIGGQSVLFWVAAGLGHNLIQETYNQPYTKDSIIPRPNAIYTDCQAGLVAVYDVLELDKKYLQGYPVPAPRVNLSTSAGSVRTNLSTSAEIIQAHNAEREAIEHEMAIRATYPSVPFFN